MKNKIENIKFKNYLVAKIILKPYRLKSDDRARDRVKIGHRPWRAVKHLVQDQDFG